MNDDKYNLYDNLVATSILNLNNFSNQNGKIILRNFDINNPKHLFLFNTALISCMYNDIKRKIYIEAGLIDYIKIKIPNRKRAKIRKYNHSFQTDYQNDPVDIDEILEYMAEAYAIDTETFADIYYEYYNE